MRIIENELRKRRTELDKLIRTLEKTLSEAPAGKLRTVTDNGRTRYYIRSVPSDRSGKYVSRDNMAKAEAIAQRDYDYLLKKAAEQERSAIDVLLKTWESGTIEVVRDSLALPRQKLIMPRAMSDADYAEYWRSIPYKPKEFKEGEPLYFSAGGTRVRSKSEALLTDIFDSYSIPAKYECPLRLWNGRIIHPDFTLLNIAERKVFIWEHFGRADDPVYMEYNVGRLNDLIKSGWYPGENLILTFETEHRPLNTEVVHDLIKEFLI